MESGRNKQIDRTEWGAGEWDQEDDYYQWTDALSGYTCLVQRNMFGALCGYVGIPVNHPFYEKDWHERLDELSPMVMARRDKPFKPEDSSMPNYFGLFMAALDDQPGMELALLLDVHAGVTFAGRRALSKDPTLWFFGFDCGHADDYQPGMAVICSPRFRLHMEQCQTYRSISFVKAQCEKLAKQLLAYGSTN